MFFFGDIDDVESSRAVSEDIFTSQFECTPVKVDAILGGIDFDEVCHDSFRLSFHCNVH